MTGRIRTAGLAGVVVLLLMLSSATPMHRGGSGAPGGAGAASALPGGQPDPSASPQPVVVPAIGAVAPGMAVQELSTGDDRPVIEFDAAGNVVGMTAPPGGSIPNPAGGGTDGFVRRYAGAFGLNSSYAAVNIGAQSLPGGDTVTRYRQTSGGLPVLGGDVVVTADAQGEIKGVTAEATQATPTATTPAISAAEAGRVALDAAVTRFSLNVNVLKVGSAELWIYDPALIGAPGTRGARPTWWVELVGVEGGDKAATVLVDATDATVALALTAKREAQPDRIVCDLNGVENVREFDLFDRNVYGCNDYSALGRQSTTRHEGGATSAVGDVNRAFDHLGVTRAFYETNFGIDSYDGRGAQLRATVRACQQDIVEPPFIYDYYCPFPNAFWDGYQFVFGQGYAVDDVTAHEYTHAVIDHTSQLFYAYQSGAINEGLADIFGEFVDQSYAGPVEDPTKLWLIGEDLPIHPVTGRRELRDMADPKRLGQPDTLFGMNYYGGDDDNGGVHQNSGVANKLAYLVAAGGTVNFDSFPGIGTAKSKILWYRAMHQMPSGGDYPTLGRVLERACVELVGHSGFTAADCFTTVRQARIATGLNYGGPYFGCGGGATANPALFQDDFEQPGKWTLTAGWQYIPSTEIPISYAASGKGALYGWAAPGGPAEYATMKDAVTIPPNNTYGIFLYHRVLPYSLGINQTTTGPLWQYDDVNDVAGWQNLAAAFAIHGGDYQEWWIDITMLAQKTVKLRLRAAPNDGSDWLIDDVYINQCNYTYFAQPYDISAVWSGTSAVVSWKYDSMPQQHIELSYNPAIPGAPATLPGFGVNQSGVAREVTLNGLDPAVTYTVTITIIDDQNHEPPRPVSFELKSQPDPLCLTAPPLPFRLWTPPKPNSTDACGPTSAPPRRTG